MTGRADSPLLTPEALEAAEPWRTEWRTEEDGVRRPMSYTLSAEAIARAFLAAHDPDALTKAVRARLVPGSSAYVGARAVIDALGLGGDDA